MLRKSKLKQYSTLAISFLAVKESAGEAIYTDIEPDIVLESHGEVGAVDMDNDGIFDFAFLNTSGTLTSSSFIESYVDGIWAGPNLIQNGIAGYMSYDSGSGGFTQYFPYALANASGIGPSLPFYNWGFQRMVFRYFNEDFVLINAGGYWYPDVSDHYLGVRFIDTLGCNHYGWIRCEVKDENRTLIVKDYAYESKCDVSIAAGDLIGNTIEFDYEKGDIHTEIDDELFSGVNIYNFNDHVYIKLNDLTEKTEVYISDSGGRLIYSVTLLDMFSDIHLATAPGLYLIQLVSNNTSHTAKVFLN